MVGFRDCENVSLTSRHDDRKCGINFQLMWNQEDSMFRWVVCSHLVFWGFGLCFVLSVENSERGCGSLALVDMWSGRGSHFRGVRIVFSVKR